MEAIDQGPLALAPDVRVLMPAAVLSGPDLPGTNQDSSRCDPGTRDDPRCPGDAVSADRLGLADRLGPADRPVSAGHHGPADRLDPSRDMGPAVNDEPSGDHDPVAELAELIRTCTSRFPEAWGPDEDPLAAADRLLRTEGVGAVVLLVPGPTAQALRKEARSQVVVAAVEEFVGRDAADRIVALLLAAQHPPRAQVVAVTGARGGLGASTFLLHVARACAASSLRVALVDADPAGGMGLLVGDGLVPGLRWADLPDDETAFRPERLVSVLPTWLGMPVLTGDGRGGPVSPAAVGPALDALRALHDVVLLDLPRGALAPPGASVLLVSGLDLRSALAAEALSGRMRASGGPLELRLVVRLIGEDVTAEELTALTGAPVLASIPHDRAVVQRIARGDDPTRGRGRSRAQARLVADYLVGLMSSAACDDEGCGPDGEGCGSWHTRDCGPDGGGCGSWHARDCGPDGEGCGPDRGEDDGASPGPGDAPVHGAGGPPHPVSVGAADGDEASWGVPW